MDDREELEVCTDRVYSVWTAVAEVVVRECEPVGLLTRQAFDKKQHVFFTKYKILGTTV